MEVFNNIDFVLVLLLSDLLNLFIISLLPFDTLKVEWLFSHEKDVKSKLKASVFRLTLLKTNISFVDIFGNAANIFGIRIDVFGNGNSQGKLRPSCSILFSTFTTISDKVELQRNTLQIPFLTNHRPWIPEDLTLIFQIVKILLYLFAISLVFVIFTDAAY